MIKNEFDIIIKPMHIIEKRFDVKGIRINANDLAKIPKYADKKVYEGKCKK